MHKCPKYGRLTGEKELFSSNNTEEQICINGSHNLSQEPDQLNKLPLISRKPDLPDSTREDTKEPVIVKYYLTKPGKPYSVVEHLKKRLSMKQPTSSKDSDSKSV